MIAGPSVERIYHDAIDIASRPSARRSSAPRALATTGFAMRLNRSSRTAAGRSSTSRRSTWRLATWHNGDTPSWVGRTIRNYDILALVGVGGMGEVYRARDTRLDRAVAIKVLSPQLAHSAEFHQRFEREARTISALTIRTSAPCTTSAGRMGRSFW